MALFGKKKEKEIQPQLPPLPKLPDIPSMYEDQEIDYGEDEETNYDKEYLGLRDKLPAIRFPKKEEISSKNKIKAAITEESDLSEDIFDEKIGKRADQFPIIKGDEHFRKEVDQQKPISYSSINRPQKSVIMTEKTKNSEPVFIRIDKFQEALETFDETKKKINEIEKILSEIKSVKEKEDQEIREWEAEISNIKQKIEKVEFEVFSKL